MYKGNTIKAESYQANAISSNFTNNSTHLRGFFRLYFPQVGPFNLDVHWIFCAKFIYFHKTFHLWFSLFTFQVNSKFWNVWILGKMPNLNPKIIIYPLPWHFGRLFWNKLAKNERICVLKNSVESFVSKINFFLNKYTKACWSHLNSPNIWQFFLSSRWNK